jgi:hypothetical protein
MNQISLLLKKALRPRYALKSQDIISIDVDKFKYSYSTNSMNDSLMSMPCSNGDHVDRVDFLENEKEETFMFDPINLTPKEPLPNDELSAMHEAYASFIYTFDLLLQFTCGVNYGRVCLQ